MSYEPNLEDTRPQPAIRDEALTPGEVYGGIEEEARPGMGCGMLAFAGGALVLLAVIIVALASFAGWTTGQREASAFATATQASAIIDQVNRIPQDIASGNTTILNARLQYLATLTPGVPQVAEFSGTATALYTSRMLSATPAASATPIPEQPPQATAAASAEPTLAIEGFDTEVLLAQARLAVDSGQWNDAIELLDAVSGIDPDYESASVRRLLGQALNSYARELFNTYRPGDPGRLAEAIVLTDRAEQIGPLGDGLAYERNAAQLYLDARRTISLDPWQAIRALQGLYDLGQGRYFQEAQQELYNQWMALGDGQTSINEYCPAVQYYQNALNILATSAAAAKRDNATTVCSQATPVPLPGTLVAPPPGSTIAPLGVPGT